MVNVSTYNLVVLTLEQYLNIIHPFWSKRFITTRLEKFMLVAPWVIGPFIEFSSWSFYMEVKDGKYWCTTIVRIMGLIYLIVAFLIPLTVLIYCYGRIWYRVKTRWINLETHTKTTRTKGKTSILYTIYLIVANNKVGAFHAQRFDLSFKNNCTSHP